jgi:P-type conjugative transfer protein TrbJ
MNNVENATRRNYIKFALASCAVMATAKPQITLAAGSASGLATEYTQFANYGLLLKQLNEQISMVMHQFNSYRTMVTNLIQLPQSVINSVTQPVADVLSTIDKMRGSLSGLKDSVGEVGTIWQRQTREMTLLGENPQEYFRKQKLLADVRGGKYHEQWKTDIDAAEDLKTRATEVQNLSRRIPDIDGNIKGMQLLNSQINIVASGINDLLTTIRKDSINVSQDRMDAEQAKYIEAQRNIERIEAQRQVNDKLKNVKSGWRAPWEY